jgi:hypothetical protein
MGMSNPSRKQIESLLSQALTPVEPSTRFVSSLRARLVTYRGEGPVSSWMILATAATVILMAASAMSVLLRLLIGGIGILGLLKDRRLPRRNSKRAAA